MQVLSVMSQKTDLNRKPLSRMFRKAISEDLTFKLRPRG